MLKPKKYILKNLEIIFNEVKDYTSKTPTEQISGVTLQRITLRIAPVYTAVYFRYSSQVHNDRVLFLSLPTYATYVICCTLKYFPRSGTRKFTESTRSPTMLLPSGTWSRYIWKITEWLGFIQSRNLSFLFLYRQIISNFAMGTEMKATFP